MTLKEQNEILRNKVKHLESFVNFLDSDQRGKNPPSFESYNHITKRNKDGNLITYYTK